MSQAKKNSLPYTLALYSFLITVALILSYIEALLPPLGMFRLGLANIAVTLGIYLKSRKCGFTVMLCRVCITSLLFGSVTSFIFSLIGGTLAFTAAAFLKTLFIKNKITLLGVSVLSAASHNIGQVIAACFVLGTAAPTAALWWLLLAGVPTGALTGVVAQIILSRIGGKLS